MDKRVVVGLIGSFIAGACAGIAGTFIYMKEKYCEEKIEEGIQDYILHRYDGKELSGDDAGKEEKDEPSINTTTVPKYVTPDKERVPYNEFYEKKSPQDILAEREHPLDSNEDDDDNDILEDLSEEERENYIDGLNKSEEHRAYVDGELPSVERIPEDEWDMNPDYEGITLFYWLGDDTLTDEEEETIFPQLQETLSDIFTEDVIDRANRDTENYKIFVRNHEFMKDYMILFVDRAYWESH